LTRKLDMRLVLEALLLCGLLASIALCAFHPLYAVDFFWHLELGKVISDTGHIPRTNLFSSAEPSRPYVQFNWLWDVLAAQVVRAFGFHGMRVAQALAIAGSYALLYQRARASFRMPALAFAFVALAFVLFEDRFQERPAALVLAFVAALWPILLGGYRDANGRTLAFVFALGVLWSNLHGGEALLLLMSIGALFVGELCVRRWLPERKHAVTPALRLLGVSLLAVLASPTALPGLLHWSQAIGPQIALGNEEWLPSYTMLRNGLRPAFMLIAFAPTLVLLLYVLEQVTRVRRLGRAAIEPAEWLLCAGYLVLAHQAVRNSFLCIVPLAFMLRRLVDKGHVRALPQTAALAALALVAIALEDSLSYSYGGFARVPEVMRQDLAPDAFPELASKFMQEAGIEGGILNDGHWGGYLIYRLWPRCGVFADTRHHFTREMWDVFVASNDPLQRPQALRAAQARWGIELAVFRAPTFPLLVPPSAWRLLYKAGPEEVYQHIAGAHAAQNLERTQAWLRRQGVATPDDAGASSIPTLASALGARRYFARPTTRARMNAADASLRSSDPAQRGRGYFDRGTQLYVAGDYSRAIEALERAASLLGPADQRPSFYLAFAYFALGMPDRALPYATRALAAHAWQNARQQHRLQALVSALSQPATARDAATQR
jgi:tetratricopeptide (TPR) repeat protein